MIGAGGRSSFDLTQDRLPDTGWKPRGILSQDPNLGRFPIIFEYL
jgi:hypothetical protein